jgi:hypothetical protein
MLCETTSDGDLDAARRRGRWGTQPTWSDGAGLRLATMFSLHMLKEETKC